MGASVRQDGAVGLDVRLGGGPPGELGSPLEGGDPQGPAPLGLGVQDHETPGNGLDVRSAVGDGVAPDLRRLSSRVVSTAAPQAMASRTGRPKPSPMEG